ncbi:carboxypeptidase regulatory-like domain-containing protein [Nocardioides nitrophenolicus]|uniref:carboxypeptidase regulatory-like domain-containing protein n=1 Tax=Nocardioides nitrophenolicus TaxID=60489 RepID=UPI001958EC82|nr:carboxypeptidase regulatory-like domain-containing protein [Nocardioides nitrophenolicus]MBM7516012.1 hypothetical protein [Nocardioides nitrophenolicus]
MRKQLMGAATVATATTAALLGLGTLVAPTAHAADPHGFVTGTVTADAGGAGLEGVAVGAWFQKPDQSWTAVWVTTDSAGRYKVPAPPGDTRIQFVECGPSCTDPSYAPEFYDDVATRADAQVISVADGQTVSGVDAALAAAYLVSGQVTAPDDSAAADAYVVVYGEDDTLLAQARTGADGRYRLVLPAGSYRFAYADATLTHGEFYEDERSLADATPVVVGADKTDLDVHLDLNQVRNAPDSPPAINGIARVGDTLAAGPGLWYPFSGDYTYTYAWYRTGSAQPIGTQPTLKVPPAALGETITVEVTASLDGYTSGTATSAPTATVVASPAALPNTAPPTVSGPLQVGRTVTAGPGTWAQQPTAVSYQWYAGARAIAGATTSTLAITPDLVGVRLAVRVAASAPGTLFGYAWGTTATQVEPGTLSLASVPTLAGKAKVGKRLTVVPGASTPAATVQVQWLAKGKPIAGATKPTLKLKKALKRAKVRAVVTYTAPGYAPLVVRTTAVRVR